MIKNMCKIIIYLCMISDLRESAANIVLFSEPACRGEREMCQPSRDAGCEHETATISAQNI